MSTLFLAEKTFTTQEGLQVLFHFSGQKSLSMFHRFIIHYPFASPFISAKNFSALLFWKTYPPLETTDCQNCQNRLRIGSLVYSLISCPLLLMRTGWGIFGEWDYCSYLPHCFCRALHMPALLCLVSSCLFSILKSALLIILILLEIMLEINCLLLSGFCLSFFFFFQRMHRFTNMLRKVSAVPASFSFSFNASLVI